MSMTDENLQADRQHSCSSQVALKKLGCRNWESFSHQREVWKAWKGENTHRLKGGVIL